MITFIPPSHTMRQRHHRDFTDEGHDLFGDTQPVSSGPRNGRFHGLSGLKPMRMTTQCHAAMLKTPTVLGAFLLSPKHTHPWKWRGEKDMVKAQEPIPTTRVLTPADTCYWLCKPRAIHSQSSPLMPASACKGSGKEDRYFPPQI